MKVDKQSFDEVVCFNDENHKYFTKDTKESFISVTTLIHKFSQEFDEQFWSRYKALQKLAGEDEFDGPVIGKNKRGPASPAKEALLDTKKYDHKWTYYFGVSEEELEEEAANIRAYYVEEREKSCFRGTKIHKNMEDSITSKSSMNIDFLTGEHASAISGLFKFSENTKELVPGNVYPEILLYRISPDGELKVAGQVDLLIIDHDGGVYILDWKTNKELKKKSYYNQKVRKSVRMKYPLNNLDDCNFNHYQLQLSLYYWIVSKQNPNLFLKGLYIVHFDHNGNETTHQCEYLKDEVERMLTFYKKDLKHNSFKQQMEKITY